MTQGRCAVCNEPFIYVPNLRNAFERSDGQWVHVQCVPPMEPWESPPSTASAFDPRHSEAWQRTERTDPIKGYYAQQSGQNMQELIYDWDHRNGEPDGEIISRVKAVLALHRRTKEGRCAECTTIEEDVEWPCATVRALNGERR